MTQAPSAPAPTPLPIDFGHRYLLDRLDTRLRQSLGEGGTSPLEPALVAGVFGEWGSGKSHLLHGVAQRVRGWERQEGVLNVVVEFNAWRYEREDHLLIPLLKVAQQALEKALTDDLEQHYADKLRAEKLKAFARAGVERLGKLGKAFYTKGGRELLQGALLSAGVPVVLPEYKPDEKKAEAPPPPPPEPSPFAAIQEMESLYFDFLAHLQRITGSNPEYLESHRQRRAQGVLRDDDPEDLRVNLIFLVDDLDRCLPDKAVAVLEVIKLFLDVPGCAFVLALDEEVIERGISHRYKDYILQGKSTIVPITGAEYLEKLIHLPIRLPRLSRLESELYLAKIYRDEFSVGSAGGKPNELARWVVALTPAVPRKLYRMAELFRLAEGVVNIQGGVFGVSLNSRRKWLILACALQLFTPVLFRYLRIHGANLLDELVSWRDSGRLNDLAILKEQLVQRRRDAGSPQDLSYQLKLERLPDLVDDAINNRSGLDFLTVLGHVGKLQRTTKLKKVELGAVLSFVLAAEDDLEMVREGYSDLNIERRENSGQAMSSDGQRGSSSRGRSSKVLPLDYSLPRFAILENDFSFDEAVRSGDAHVLENALAIEGVGLLGRLVPDELVEGWCTEDGLSWLPIDQDLDDKAREFLHILGPYLSQWAALRMAIRYGAHLLVEMGRFSWMAGFPKLNFNRKTVDFIFSIPGLQGFNASYEFSRKFQLPFPVDARLSKWRPPMGFVFSGMSFPPANGRAPYFLGGDEYGIFADVDFFGVTQRFRYIPSGKFYMGSSGLEQDSVAQGNESMLQWVRKKESPIREVILNNGFWLADTPCTQELWMAIFGENPSFFKNNLKNPVEQVGRRQEIEEFLASVQKLLPDGCVASLPSEEQWEYACRAGSDTQFSWGDNFDPRFTNVANSNRQTTPVKKYSPNAWGLYDMHGNVWEWCSGSVYDLDSESESLERKALRGGSWFNGPSYCRSAFHFECRDSLRWEGVGFRFAINLLDASSI